jgi:hypothetical protein
MDGELMHDHTDDAARRQECPPWCERRHRPGVHADDQHHVSTPRRIALVTGDPALDSDDLAVGGAVVARLIRRTNSDLTWVEVVSEEGRDVRLVVTVDSARRLLAVLQELVAIDVA